MRYLFLILSLTSLLHACTNSNAQKNGQTPGTQAPTPGTQPPLPPAAMASTTTQGAPPELKGKITPGLHFGLSATTNRVHRTWVLRQDSLVLTLRCAGQHSRRHAFASDYPEHADKLAAFLRGIRPQGLVCKKGMRPLRNRFFIAEPGKDSTVLIAECLLPDSAAFDRAHEMNLELMDLFRKVSEPYHVPVKLQMNLDNSSAKNATSLRATLDEISFGGTSVVNHAWAIPSVSLDTKALPGKYMLTCIVYKQGGDSLVFTRPHTIPAQGSSLSFTLTDKGIQ